MTLQWDMGLLEDTWWHVVDYYSCVVGDARAARRAKSKMTRSMCINVASQSMTDYRSKQQQEGKMESLEHDSSVRHGRFLKDTMVACSTIAAWLVMRVRENAIEVLYNKDVLGLFFKTISCG